MGFFGGSLVACGRARSSGVLAAGIGTSQKPSVTGAIVLSDATVERHPDTSDDPNAGEILQAVQLKPTFGKVGVLKISGQTTGLDRATAAELLGEHTLQFP